MDATGRGPRDARSYGCFVAAFYNEVRTHVALGKDAPLHRPCRQSVVSRQSLGSEAFIISTFGWRDRYAHHSWLYARSDEILGSHREQNVTFALPHADRVYVLEHARIVWEGDPGRFAEEMGTAYL
jgi:hypothetical protein